MRLPFVSIIVAVGKNNPNLQECIQYCLVLDYPSFELLILPDEDWEHRYPANVKIIPTGKELPAKKRDIGVDHAQGEIVAFLDDDTYPEKDWLINAVNIFLEKDTIASVCGPAVTPSSNDLMQQASGLIYSSWLVGGSYRYRYVPQSRRDVDDYPTCNLLVRKSVMQELGGFNTIFWPGEDTKLCLEIVEKLKQKIVYDPKVLVYHHRRRLFRGHMKQILSYGLHRGYFAKRFPATSLRLSYFLPTLLVLGTFFGWLLGFIHPILFYLYFIGLGIYLFVAFITGLIAKSERYPLNVVLKIAVFVGVIVSHFGYGIWFVKGLLASKLPEE
jgi:cellulose synthase/poly-beta-1,6-N-acetylglucosamine synthase-like glycosyltransferase